MTATTLRKPVLSVCLAALLAFWASAARADDKPVASTTSQDGKVHVDILSLKRTEGGTMTLRFVLADNGDSSYAMVLPNMHLVDLASRRSYGAGLSSPCSTSPDQRVTCWAVFAAPPPATKTMTVQFYENLDLLTGVPVTE